MKRHVMVLFAALALAAILFMLSRIPKNIDYANASGINDTSESAMPSFYPEHPKMTDCEKTSKRDFCIGDVAEISNNVSICQQINDPDIRNFCTARISLDRNLCGQLLDEGLRDACLESIELKTNYSESL